MARIEGLEPSQAGFWKGLVLRIAYWMARRKVGQVPTPMKVKAHHLGVLIDTSRMDLAESKRKLVDAKLKGLASLRTAALVGCPF